MRFIIILIVLGGFAAGVYQLFLLRFKTGDVLPEYSSLRADPLGVKAFYNGLDALPEIRVERNFKALDKIEPEGTTLFYLNTSPANLVWSPDEYRAALDSFALRGGRLVIFFYPVKTGGYIPSDWEIEKEIEKEKAEKKKKKEEAAKKREAEEEKAKSEEDEAKDVEKEKTEEGKPAKKEEKKDKQKSISYSVFKKWGFDLDIDPKWNDVQRHAARTKERGLPYTLEWHSAMYFTKLKSPWKVLFSWSKQPVVIERQYGKGSIVLATDPYHLSNEAMRELQQIQLLTWLVGPNTRVVFDEAHLGLEEQVGVAGLGRKYRLHGLFFGLLVLGALFIWKNAFSLIPPEKDEQSGVDVLTSPRDYNAGMVSLLRRNVRKNVLVRSCFDQWASSSEAQRPDLKDRVEKARQAAVSPEGANDPVSVYKKIHRILWEGRKP